jgi:hypothetical protein
LSASIASPTIIIHNAQTSPDADLTLYPKDKIAEFTPVDADREALSSDDPVDELKKFAMEGVKSAPDETYQGKPARVFISEKSEQIDGGRQSRTRRVLVDHNTGLPVRIEIDGDMTKIGQGSYRLLIESFEWNPATDEKTFSTDPPAGYSVRYDCLKPLSHALAAYVARFNGHLPDRIDAAGLASLKQRLKTAANGKDKSLAEQFDADWGFSIPRFAERHKLDFRYYGAGKTLGDNKPPEAIVAIETAPDSAEYDVLMSDRSRARMERSKLP